MLSEEFALDPVSQGEATGGSEAGQCFANVPPVCLRAEGLGTQPGTTCHNGISFKSCFSLKLHMNFGFYSYFFFKIWALVFNDLP